MAADCAFRHRYQGAGLSVSGKDVIHLWGVGTFSTVSAGFSLVGNCLIIRNYSAYAGAGVRRVLGLEGAQPGLQL